jgi:hypothetical protein
VKFGKTNGERVMIRRKCEPMANGRRGQATEEGRRGGKCSMLVSLKLGCLYPVVVHNGYMVLDLRTQHSLVH